MNKNLKNIVDKAKGIANKIKKDRKVQGILVAGIVVVTVASGVTYYVLNNKDTGKKEIVSSDTIKEDEIKSDDLILAEDENGNLVVKDQEGNVVAEGDEVAKVVEEKKEEGKNIVAQTSDGSIVKVDKVDGNNVQTESGQTVKPTPKPPAIVDNDNNTNKPSTGTDKPSIDKPNTDNNTGNSNNNNNNNNSENNKPNNGNNGNSNNGGSTSKPQEPSKPTPPVEQPKPETKPEVKPEPPKRTWTYMADMSRETFNLMNKFRQDNGVAPLKWSDSEHARAKKQAEKIASTAGSGHDFMQISLTTISNGNPQGFINQWANSSGHKASMLEKNYVEGAVAVYKDSDGEYFVVASFNDGW